MSDIPKTPAEWQGRSDSELVTLAQDYAAHVSVVAQIEAVRRLIVALHASKQSADRFAAVLVLLTVALVVLTAVLAIHG